MNINGFDFLSNDRFPGFKGVGLAVKNGSLYQVFRCNPFMTDDRASSLSSFYDEIIHPDSNIVKPVLFQIDGVWYHAVEYRPRICESMPVIYYRCFPTLMKKHIVLTALAAIDTLGRNGAIHGSLSPERFQFSMSEEGFVYSTLMGGLTDIGYNGHSPLPSSTVPFYAPDVWIEKGPPSSASDVFAMGVCCHVWLCGEYPRINGTDKMITQVCISSSIEKKDQFIIAAMLEIDPKNRPTISQAMEAFRDKTFDHRNAFSVYYDSEFSIIERDSIRLALLPKSTPFIQRYLS